MRIRQRYQLKGTDLVIDDSEVRVMFAQAPISTFRWMRDYVGQCMGSFRRDWIAAAKARLGGKERLLRSFIYTITPGQNEYPAQGNLSAISAAFSTNSPVALGLETGGTYGPRAGSKYLSIPIPGGPAFNSAGVRKKNYASPRTARASGPGANVYGPTPGELGSNPNAKTFFVFHNRKGKMFLAELFARGAGDHKRYWFELAFRLEPQVTVKPILRFIATWDAMAPDRARRLIETKARITAEINSGLGR